MRYKHYLAVTFLAICFFAPKTWAGLLTQDTYISTVTRFDSEFAGLVDIDDTFEWRVTYDASSESDTSINHGNDRIEGTPDDFVTTQCIPTITDRTGCDFFFNNSVIAAADAVLEDLSGFGILGGLVPNDYASDRTNSTSVSRSTVAVFTSDFTVFPSDALPSILNDQFSFSLNISSRYERFYSNEQGNDSSARLFFDSRLISRLPIETGDDTPPSQVPVPATLLLMGLGLLLIRYSRK
ncbi:MAG: PEP-CTERM sorting domain-containing protein [Pseudomonadota bacterium]